MRNIGSVPRTRATRGAAPRGGRRDARVPAAAAALGVFLLALATPPDGPALGTASAATVRDFVAANTVALRVSATGGVLLVVAILVLSSSLAALARARAPESVVPGVIGTAGGLLAGVYLLNTAALSMHELLPGLVGTRLAELDDAVVRSWYDFSAFTHLLGDLQMALIAVVLLAFSVAARRWRLVPRWLVWIGAIVGGSAALGTVGITTASSPLYPLWFVGLFGWWLWTLLIAATFTLQLRREGKTETQPATP